MSPDIFLLQRLMRVALSQEVLKEAHILETEQRYGVVGLS